MTGSLWTCVEGMAQLLWPSIERNQTVIYATCCSSQEDGEKVGLAENPMAKT